MYKAIFTISVFCLLAFNVLGQKNVKCKSGQLLELTSKGDLVNTNSQDLLDKQMDKDSIWKITYASLVNAEMENRITYANKEVEITLLQYEKNRNKAEEKTYVNRILVVKKELKDLDKIYQSINADISKLLSKNNNDVNTVITKYGGSIQNKDPQLAAKPKEEVLSEAVKKTETKEEEAPEIKMAEEKPKMKSEKPKASKKDHCQPLFKGRNEKTGKKQVVLYPDVLFTYTPEQMKNYFRLDNYLSGIFSFEKYDGKLYINAELRFNSKDVQKSYGSINKKDFMRLDFINGKQIFLSAIEVEDPYIENYTGNTIYKAKYELIDNADEEAIKNQFLDKLGILWSSGYESYTIHKVDFMKEKMACLEHAN